MPFPAAAVASAAIPVVGSAISKAIGKGGGQEGKPPANVTLPTPTPKQLQATPTVPLPTGGRPLPSQQSFAMDMLRKQGYM